MDLSRILEFLWLGSGGIFCLIWSIQNLIEKYSKPNLIWSLILSSTGIWLIVGSFFFSSFHLLLPEISLIHIPFIYISAPLLYVYLEYIFLEKQLIINPILMMPAILSFVFITPFYFSSKSEMIQLLQGEQISTYSNILLLLNIGAKISILISVGLFLGKHLLPNLQIKIFFQKNAIYTFIFVFVIWIDLLIGTVGFFCDMAILRKMSALLLPTIMYFYFFTRKFWTPFLADFKDSIQKTKYEKSKITSIDINELEFKLTSLMKEKIFCDEDLTLSRLAQLLEIKQGQLSEFFQRRYGYGFYQFINKHRVEEAKLLISESESRSILSIADAVGFNSKSTFNRVFQDLVGQTPSEYRVAVRNSKKYPFQ